MLNNISWASYAYAISIIVVIYYVVIITVYFRDGLQRLFKRNNVHFPIPIDKGMPESREADGMPDKLQLNNPDNDTDELMLSLRSLIKKAAARKYPKEELLLSLQLRLQNYPSLRGSQLKDAVNNFIKTECENNCSIHLSDDEVKVLWGV